MTLELFEIRLIWSWGNIGFICIAMFVPSDAPKFTWGFCNSTSIFTLCLLQILLSVSKYQCTTFWTTTEWKPVQNKFHDSSELFKPFSQEFATDQTAVICCLIILFSISVINWSWFGFYVVQFTNLIKCFFTSLIKWFFTNLIKWFLY
jgi:hypothetical protein